MLMSLPLNSIVQFLTSCKKQGTPIPTNDIWIAATALQKGLPVYTFDQHFEHIAGLLLR